MGWLVSDRGWLAIDMVSMGWLGSHESDYGWPVISTQIEGEKYTFSQKSTFKDCAITKTSQMGASMLLSFTFS